MTNEMAEKQIVSVRQAEPSYEKCFLVSWNLGSKLNNPKYETVLQFAESIIKDCKKNRKTSVFEFIDSEQTEWDMLSHLMKDLKTRGAKISFISYGHKDISWWQQNIDYLDKVCLHFRVDQSTAENLLASSKLLGKVVKTHVNIVMLPDRFDESYAIALDLLKIENISLSLVPLSGTSYSPIQDQMLKKQFKLVGGNMRFTQIFDDFRGLMKQVYSDGSEKTMAPYDFIMSGENKWQGWNCGIGVEQVVIEKNDVFRNWCKVGGQLGSVKDGLLVVPRSSVKCNRAQCDCLTGAMASKTNPRFTVNDNSWKKLFQFWKPKSNVGSASDSARTSVSGKN